jgi:hypothetical protein
LQTDLKGDFDQLFHENEQLSKFPLQPSCCDILTGTTDTYGSLCMLWWAFDWLVLVLVNAWITTRLLWTRFYCVYSSSKKLYVFDYKDATGTYCVIATCRDNSVIVGYSGRATEETAPTCCFSGPLFLVIMPSRAFYFWNQMEREARCPHSAFEKAREIACKRLLWLLTILAYNIICAGCIIIK